MRIINQQQQNNTTTYIKLIIFIQGNLSIHKKIFLKSNSLLIDIILIDYFKYI